MISQIEIAIKKIEVINKKIKFNIRINIYLLKKIKIFSKKISKKDIVKFINFSEEKEHFRKEKKLYYKLDIEVPQIELKIKYGITHIFINTYLYGILNGILYTILANYLTEKTDKKIEIQTNFKANEFYFKLKLLIRINILKSIISMLREKIKEYNILEKNGFSSIKESHPHTFFK